MSQTSQSCREHAQECRELARLYRDPSGRQIMENIARTWEDQAEYKAKHEPREDERFWLDLC